MVELKTISTNGSVMEGSPGKSKKQKKNKNLKKGKGGNDTPTAESPKGTVKNDKTKKNFGQFGNRNAVKVKNDQFTKMVKAEAVKENISPAFLKKLDTCLARLPAAGKRFVNWMVHDVKYKIKFLPLIEEVFALIKKSNVLPLPPGTFAPRTKSEKQKLKQKKRKEKYLKKKQEEKGDEANSSPSPENAGIKRKSLESNPDGDSDLSKSAQKKKKVKKEKINESGVDLDQETSLNASIENDTSNIKIKKEKKKRKSLGKQSSD